MNALRALRLSGCCLAVAILVAGCGGSKSSSTSASSSTTTRTTAQRAPPPIVKSITPEKFRKPKNPGPHPNAKIDHLIIKDIAKGRGPIINAGDTGIFDFIGTNYISGAPLESSWGRKRPFETRIDHGIVIDGWWQGIPGMRVGGRRQLIIPPSLGFTQSVNPDVNGKTVYFDVVLLGVLPAQPAGTGGQAAPASPSISSG